MSYMDPEQGLTDTGEEDECRECGKPTTTTDYIGPICKECFDRDASP